MKRTSRVNLVYFRKSWISASLTPIALAVGILLSLSGCEQSSGVQASFYKDADECTRYNPELKSDCEATYGEALSESVKSAPKYESLEDCVADFGVEKCTPVPENSVRNSSGGIPWMPLMAGYMMGRLSGGYVGSALFSSNNPSSPAYNRFVDANGNNYGYATTGRTSEINKRAFDKKPEMNRTIRRGGFGNMMANRMKSTRSYGG